MVTVTVSPKFQVIIPRAIRENLDIKAGQKLQIIQYVIEKLELLEKCVSR